MRVDIKIKINEKDTRLLSLDRPGRLTDATRGNKREKKNIRGTQAHGYIHTNIHTPAARLKRIRTKMEHFYIHDACASA